VCGWHEHGLGDYEGEVKSSFPSSKKILWLEIHKQVGNWEYRYHILANLNVYFIAYVVEGITFVIKDISLSSQVYVMTQKML
jgi:hypothetical protein